MNQIIILLLAFVVLGLLRDRLGRSTYLLMGIAIVAYIAYAYHYGG